MITQFTKREMTTHEIGTDPDFEGVQCAACHARNIIKRGGTPEAGQLCCNCKKPLVAGPDEGPFDYGKRLATEANEKFWNAFLGG